MWKVNLRNVQTWYSAFMNRKGKLEVLMRVVLYYQELKNKTKDQFPVRRKNTMVYFSLEDNQYSEAYCLRAY